MIPSNEFSWKSFTFEKTPEAVEVERTFTSPIWLYVDAQPRHADNVTICGPRASHRTVRNRPRANKSRCRRQAIPTTTQNSQKSLAHASSALATCSLGSRVVTEESVFSLQFIDGRVRVNVRQHHLNFASYNFIIY